jgi:signal transduction histidine kinase
MLLTLSPYTFKSVDISSGQPVPVPGPGIIPFTIFGLFFTGLTLYTLVRRARAATKEVRSQLLTVTAGILLMLVLLIGTVFIPVVIYHNNMFVSLVPLYSLIFLFITAYAIMRHQLFKFKLPFIELATLFLLSFLLLNILFSTSETNFVFNLFIFIGVLGIGLLLIQSVKSETRHKEIASLTAIQLQKANHQLKELDKLKMDFFSMASHQLRTPLTVIKGYISLLMEGVYGGVEKNTSQVFDHLYENNERLIHLVDEFLSFNRLESGKLSYSFEQHDLTKITRDMVTSLRMKAQGKKISITFTKNGSASALVPVDKEKIQHVLYNFVDNAVKYTPHKGHVAVTLEPDAQGVTVRVRDTGIGFDEADHKHFFQKYFRGHNVERDRIAGTGLGLYVAATFIKAHHGRVWALSGGPGKGSEFGFFVPKKKKQR